MGCVVKLPFLSCGLKGCTEKSAAELYTTYIQWLIRFIIIDFSLTVKAATLLFISGRG